MAPRHARCAARWLSLVCVATLTLPAAATASGWSPLRFFPDSDPFAEVDPLEPSRTVVSASINARGDAIVGEASYGKGGRMTPMVRERTGPRGAWSAPFALTPRAVSDGSGPAVSLNGRGDALAVWSQAGRSVAARRDVHGRWRAAGTLGPVSPDAVVRTDHAALAVTVAPAGGCAQSPCAWTVALRWQRSRADPWSDAVPPLSVPVALERPAVRVSRRGDVLVAWRTGDPPSVSATRLLAGAAAFEVVQTIPTTGISSMAIGDRGDAVIAWLRSDDSPLPFDLQPPGLVHAQATIRPAASPAWGAVEDIADIPTRPIENFVYLGAAIDADGNGAVAWSTPSGGLYTTGGGPVIGAALRSAEPGTWAVFTPVKAGVETNTLDLRGVGVERGAMWVSWFNHEGPGGYSAGVLTRDAATGRWGAEQRSSVGRELGANVLAAAPDGHLLSVWSGMLVADFDDAPTPATPKAVPRAVRRTGSRVVATVTLTRAGLVDAQVRRARDNALVRRIRGRRQLAAGRRLIGLGRLPRGSYALLLAACTPRAGCTLATPFTFRVPAPRR